MQLTTNAVTYSDVVNFNYEYRTGNSETTTKKRKILKVLSPALERLLMRPPPYPDISVNTFEAAAILGLEEKTLRNWRWQGGDDRPVWVKLGDRRNSPVRYPLGPLIAWRDSHKRRSTTGS